MAFVVDIGVASRKGRTAVNEDAAGARLGPQPGDGVIAALADGVGAGGCGAEASQTVVRALLAEAFDVPPTWAASVMLERLIGASNDWLADHNRRRSHRAGALALTTLTALVLRGQTWTLAHVGDSRAWLLRHRTGRDAPPRGMRDLHPLSQDHVLEGAGPHAGLTRVVGLDDGLRIDHLEGEVLVGDTFVLTSDGVHGVLKPARLAELAELAATAAGAAQEAADALVSAAAAAGGGDDASAVVLQVRSLDARQLDDELADAQRLPVPGPLRPGDVLDGWRITARVADQGAGRVLQARDPASGALVAIKTLREARASDPAERAMLAHEAWLGRRLTGQALASDTVPPGFVRVWPRQQDASALYLVFDWHAGVTMAQLLGAGLPAVADVVEAGLALTQALGRLHRLGVVHRDIKPANLHRGEDGRWRVLDLGHALSGREGRAQRELHAGSPSYMNPEQWDGAPADAASDLYALGTSLYQWLTGRLPHGELEPYSRVAQRRDAPAASRQRPDLPIWLERLLARAIARDPAQRFETAEEMRLAFERGAARTLAALPSTPLLQRGPRPLLAAALAVSLLLNLLLVVWLVFLPR